MSSSSPTSAGGQRSSRPVGRPARLSRAQVLDTALQMLGESHGQPLSIRQLAQRLNTVPGNLYTYFSSKDALMNALAEHALGALDIELDPSLEWDGQLSQWMEGFRTALKKRPELMLLIGQAGTAPSTLAKIQRVARLMEAAGIEYERAVHHAQGLLWTVMSFTFFEMQASQPKVVRQLKQAAAHEEYRDVLRHLAVDSLEPLWQATLQRNIDGLRLQVGQQQTLKGEQLSFNL